MDPTYFGVKFFVGWVVFVLLPLFLLLHTAAALQMKGDPNLDVSLVRKELRS